jgi:hypothetical protein
MTLNSKSLAVIILLTIFGGIVFSSVMGWWVTESTKVPVTFTEGEFAGQANPADIRGSYTFGDIANSFDVSPEILAQAFGVTGDDPAAFAVKELEAIYLDSGYEIGTISVRLFVAWYTGIPFDTTGQEIYLPRSATELLLAKGNLSPDQVAYIEAHTVEVEMPSQDITSATPVASSTPSTETSVKGKTTFGELLAWGVPQAVIEQIIGGPLPDPALTLKDFATAKGLDFETLKSALQAEVDKVIP